MFTKEKVYSSFKDNIWDVDLADMQLISKNNKGIRFLLCAIDLISKYPWLVPLKELVLLMRFKKILDNSKRNPNQTWVDQDS